MLHALVDYQDAYVQPLIVNALQNSIPLQDLQIINSLSHEQSNVHPLLQWASYETLRFDLALRNDRFLLNSYVIRKALIRKHYLSKTIFNWIVKHPDSVLKKHSKPAVAFELDYAEFLDDALLEAYELRESFQRNASKPAEHREWWILKPGMSDKGEGIRLFSTQTELTQIFEEWEAERPDSDEEASDDNGGEDGPSEYVMTSQLRHFIAQPYIHPPLLFPSHGNRKFHIRVYVLAVSSLRVYVYRPMLALFAQETYSAPWHAASGDLRAHLTNTSLQTGNVKGGSVVPFWTLPDELVPTSASVFSSHSVCGRSWKSVVFDQICTTTAETFEAAARGMMVHFQPLRNAFEVFGVDFLLDTDCNASLLEFNSFPDFRQTGDEFMNIIQDLFEDVVDVAIKPLSGLDDAGVAGTERMTRVLDLDLGNR